MTAVPAKQFTCPVCGFTIITPDGIEDLAKHVQIHKEDRHPNMQMSKEELASLVKDTEIDMERMPMMTTAGPQQEMTEAWREQQNIGKGIR